ncbi:uncharacterized protein K02A2.6-like [Mercenaria mercenaria]|uniref:uncharacterized protein K02A2.6-like n=1 Tax=Mercenaria mercenaria TaxID=6596 RepID=UPI00234F649E|nr:uncharacterized protein K02A2.6-like [Mercenaria mercenaria]
MREKLINEGDKLTLDKAVEICRSLEYAQEQLREMNQAQATGSTVNAVRARRNTQELLDTGHNSSVVQLSEGLKPDTAKVSAIKEMQPPRNKAEIETILGMVNYLSRFAPNLSKVTAPIRQLLSKDVDFCWEKTQMDAFQLIKDTITEPGQGWPEAKDHCPPHIQAYWNYRDELAVVGGLIMKGNKIIMPKVMRSKMLELVHSVHMWVEKCRRRVADVMFWPGISADITNMVLNCSICLQHRNSNHREPLILTEVPDYPWQFIGTDLFTWENKSYLIVVDYYSRYFEVKEIPDMKSHIIINRMK